MECSGGSGGLCPRRFESLLPVADAAVVCVLQGRGAHSVCTLIPDPRVLERGFHDVYLYDCRIRVGFPYLQWRGLLPMLVCGLRSQATQP